jgi:hypothetical protein
MLPGGMDGSLCYCFLSGIESDHPTHLDMHTDAHLDMHTDAPTATPSPWKHLTITKVTDLLWK